MQVKIIVRTVLSRAKTREMVKETQEITKNQLKIFSSLKFCKRAVITGVGGTLLFFALFRHFTFKGKLALVVK